MTKYRLLRMSRSGADRKVRSGVLVRRSLALVVAFGLAATTLVAFAPGADAASYPSKMTSKGSWRECTKTSLPGCASRGSIPAGTTLKMNCWIDDSTATGEYSSNRWFHVTTSTGVRGFVHSSRVGSQTSVGNCSKHNGVAPQRWAAMQVGEKKPSATEASKLGIKNGMWSGWCQVFAGGAYKMTGFGALSGFGTAANTYREYKRRGLIQATISNSAISIGALVYYSPALAGGSGHVAVYAGNGYVISTQGVDDPTKPVARLPLKTWGTPVGWVKPANVDGS